MKAKRRSQSNPPGIGRVSLRLYIAGQSPNSKLAQSNLEVICQQHLPGRHDLEIVDVLQQPLRAMADGIVATPTLVRRAPGPEVRVMGALSATGPVLLALGLEQIDPPRP